MLTRLFPFLFFTLIISSCKEDAYDYLHKISTDENYVKSLTNGPQKITCAYRPSEFLAIKEAAIDSAFVLDEKKYQEAYESFKSGVYFELRIEMTDGGNIFTYGISSEPLYHQRNYYLTNMMQNDLFIIKSDGTKVFPISYKFNNAFGASKTADFLFVFSRAALKDEETIDLYFKDLAFNLNRDISFSYPASIINNVSKIKTR